MTACVLVVDDNYANCKLLVSKLEEEYYTVFIADNGSKALEMLSDHKIDLVLLDIMMPGMDGYETCQKIKANPETTHIPVIMVTAITDVDSKIKGLEVGADEFLSKPINNVPLLPRVKSLTRMKILIDELKIRNRTNQELGVSLINLQDNFKTTNILFINDDIIQARNISKILSEVTDNIWTITDPDKITTYLNDSTKINDLLNNYYPDLVIISYQPEQSFNPLRILTTIMNYENCKYAVFMMAAEEEQEGETPDVVVKAIDLGINDYFSSSADKNELIARIRTQLRRKKYQDDLRSSLDQSLNDSIRDGLTNVFNRKYIDKHINQMINNTNINNSSLSVIMIDIDHFKKVNDTYGHQDGDIVLKIFAQVVKDSIRVTDLLGRYGGEEFIILLGDTSLNEAEQIGERIRENIANAKFKLSSGIIIKKTISLGVAQYIINESAESLFKRADLALYQAKKSGRNKVILA